MALDRGSTRSVSCGGALPLIVHMVGSLVTLYGFIIGGSPSYTNCPRSVAQPVPVALAAAFSVPAALDINAARIVFPLSISATGPRSTCCWQPANITTAIATDSSDVNHRQLSIALHQLRT